MNVTENGHQHFGKDCCKNISIINLEVMFLEHQK
jgi:hypothetical protein